MIYEQFLAASLFILVSSITPGPNNTMLMASGLNFGLRRSLAHLLGVQLGFAVLVLSVGLGLHTVVQQFPLLYDGMRIAGAAYMLWMAYQLAFVAHVAPSTPAQPEDAAPEHALSAPPPVGRPMGFWAAAAFQWVNPKAWVMGVTAMTTFLPPHAGLAQLLPLVLLFLLIGCPCSFFWVGFGQAMRAWLQSPTRLRWFNRTMALALVASLYPLLQH